jgi:dihydroorotase
MVIDPSQHIHALLDVALKDKKVLKLGTDLPAEGARRVVPAQGRIVAPGLIDLHVHCYDGTPSGMNPDHCSLAKGSTTVVDAGSTGYPMIGRFIKDIVDTSITRVFPLVHIGGLGIMLDMRNALDNLDWINPELTAQAAEENKPAVIGIKVHVAKTNSRRPQELEMEVLARALRAAELSHLPLMAHINDSYYPLADILQKMRKGDIFTHCFNAFPQDSPLDANGKILPVVREARERGVIFDVAAGRRHPHFSFDVTEKCLQQGFLPDTISTDLNKANALENVFDMPFMLSKFLALGMDIDKVIELATLKPASVFNYGIQIGTLRPGSEADIGIFELQEGKFEFFDGIGAKRVGHQKLENKAVVCRGEYFVNEV